MKDQYLLVITNVTCMEEGEKIASALVEGHLAACVNISSPVISVYHWQGEICEDKERTLFIKTKRDRYEQVEEEIKRLHSYDVPEIIAVPIEAGSKDYLSWVTESTRKEQ